MSDFYATTNPDGTIEPHWVEGQREILCSVELIKQMIDAHNANIELQAKILAAVENLGRVTPAFSQSGGLGYTDERQGELLIRAEVLSAIREVTG